MRFEVEIKLNEGDHKDEGRWGAEIARMLGVVAQHVGARKPVGREPIVDRNGREVGYFTVDG